MVDFMVKYGRPMVKYGSPMLKYGRKWSTCTAMEALCEDGEIW